MGEAAGHNTHANAMDARVSALVRSVASIEATLPHLATKADLARVEAKVDTAMSKTEAAMSKMESTVIRWFIGTAILLAGLAFAAGSVFR